MTAIMDLSFPGQRTAKATSCIPHDSVYMQGPRAGKSENGLLDSKYSKMTPKFVKQKSHWLNSSIKFANPAKCSYLLHLSTEKWGVLKFSFDVVNTCSSHFTDFFGSFAWHIPFHLVHQQSSVWQYKHGSWSLNPLLFQNCHLWLWLKEQGSWLCMMHC